VILYDRDLPGKGWRETVEELAASPAPACVILLSNVLDTYLRGEVLRTGGTTCYASHSEKRMWSPRSGSRHGIGTVGREHCRI